MTFQEIMFDEFGIEVKTTFWEDFTIADKFGDGAIQDTFNRSFRAYKKDVEYAKELVLVLNHKIAYWYEKNETRADLYRTLWEKADDYCRGYFKGDDAAEYFAYLD